METVDFKLLAIRPLDECSERFLKKLTPNKIYKLYNDYKYLDHNGDEVSDGEVAEIISTSTTPENLYKISINEENEIAVNISAIVGKNGSGKSTLLELLFATCYVIAIEKGFIDDVDKLKDLINNPKVNHNVLFKKINDIQGLYNDLKVEIFYEIDKVYYCVKFIDWHLTHRIVASEDLKVDNFTENSYDPDSNTKRKFSHINDYFFFYTIAINYSLYGLNTEGNNEWLSDLFHKNDGYQTPLVLNPFKKKGNINVNSEAHLAQTRVLVNQIDGTFIKKNLINDKIISSVIFELDYAKYNTLEPFDLDNIFDQFKKDYKLNNEEFVRQIYNAIYTTKETRIKEIKLDEVKYSDLLIKYIFRKVLKISLTYDEYREYSTIPTEGRPIPRLENFYKHLISLRDDRSHITLKLRQILNCIRFNILNEDNSYKWEVEPDDYQKIKDKIKKYYFEISIEGLSSRIKSINVSSLNISLSELIPAACFIPHIEIMDAMNQDKKYSFTSLSSGEQQFIYSLQSIYYHVSNINSVFKTTTEKIKYRFINIVLDEIELYFHPEFQRNFILELLEGIKRLQIEYLNGINVLFSTHSPFILSDIPSSNILKLENGVAIEKKSRTFGANIYDLLNDEFFLKDGVIGEYAKLRIQDVLDTLNDKDKKFPIWINNPNEMKLFIQEIGEEILRTKMLEMFFKIFPKEFTDEEKLKERALLLERLKELE